MTALHVPLPGIALPGDEIYARILDKLRSGEGPFAEARRKIMSFMAGFSDAAENEILDSVFGDHATINLWAAPVYVALCTVVPTDSMTGSTITEANYTGYARKSISAADMGAAAAGTKSNTVQQQFAACTAGSSTIIGWGTCSASTAGTLILLGSVTSTVISTTQTPATLAVGALAASQD